MRDVIKLGKMKKFTVDTAMFIIRRSVIYFLVHIEICFRRTSFDAANICPVSRVR